MRIGGIAFFVPGEPKAKARANHSKPFMGKDGKMGIRSYVDDKTASYQAKVRHYLLQVCPDEPLDCPLSLNMQFVFLKPKTAKKRAYPAVKPDLDNLEKAVMDALNKLAYTDDARVVTKASLKAYTDDPKKEGVWVQLAIVE